MSYSSCQHPFVTRLGVKMVPERESMNARGDVHCTAVCECIRACVCPNHAVLPHSALTVYAIPLAHSIFSLATGYSLLIFIHH